MQFNKFTFDNKKNDYGFNDVQQPWNIGGYKSMFFPSLYLNYDVEFEILCSLM